MRLLEDSSLAVSDTARDRVSAALEHAFHTAPQRGQRETIKGLYELLHATSLQIIPSSDARNIVAEARRYLLQNGFDINGQDMDEHVTVDTDGVDAHYDAQQAKAAPLHLYRPPDHVVHPFGDEIPDSSVSAAG